MIINIFHSTFTPLRILIQDIPPPRWNWIRRGELLCQKDVLGKLNEATIANTTIPKTHVGSKQTNNPRGYGKKKDIG